MIRKTSAALAAVLLGACATSHVPRRPGHVAVVMNNSGDVVLHRDGVVYPAGAFSGNAVEAVAGVPAAEESARAYQTRRSIAVVAEVGAAVGLFASLAVWGGSFENESERALFLGLGLTAAGVALVGALFELSARSHLLDAVNLYNDAQDGPALSGAGATMAR